MDNMPWRTGCIASTHILSVSESESHSVVSDSLRPHGLYSSWNSPGQNTEVGSLSLLQGIFPTQGSNCGLLHCRQILYQLRYQGNQKLQHIRNNIIKCILCAILSCSVMSNSLRPHQAPLSMRILQARILKWAAIPFSRGSSYPRDQTQVSCIAGRFFTVWATREAFVIEQELL